MGIVFSMRYLNKKQRAESEANENFAINSNHTKAFSMNTHTHFLLLTEKNSIYEKNAHIEVQPNR